MSNRLILVFTTVLAALALTIGCYRQDVRTLVVEVPGMGSSQCSKIIQGALSRIEGIVSAEPDLDNRTITVTYDARKLSIKNVEYLIAGVGFDANGNPGKPDAKTGLPADCR